MKNLGPDTQFQKGLPLGAPPPGDAYETDDECWCPSPKVNHRSWGPLVHEFFHDPQHREISSEVAGFGSQHVTLTCEEQSQTGFLYEPTCPTSEGWPRSEQPCVWPVPHLSSPTQSYISSDAQSFTDSQLSHQDMANELPLDDDAIVKQQFPSKSPLETFSIDAENKSGKRLLIQDLRADDTLNVLRRKIAEQENARECSVQISRGEERLLNLGKTLHSLRPEVPGGLCVTYTVTIQARGFEKCAGPCRWFHKQSKECKLGEACKMCHLCDREKRSNKSAREQRRLQMKSKEYKEYLAQQRPTNAAQHQKKVTYQ